MAYAEQKKEEPELQELVIKVPKGYKAEHFTPKVFAYAQWIAISIQNKSGVDLIIENAGLQWGKWYGDNNKGKEVGAPNGVQIANGNGYTVYSCGRDSSASGTQGSFDLDVCVDNKATTRVCTMSWDCPWGSKGNTYGTSNLGVGWYPALTGGSKNSGAIGTVTLIITPNVG